jgi:hypothetical protein
MNVDYARFALLCAGLRRKEEFSFVRFLARLAVP